MMYRFILLALLMAPVIAHGKPHNPTLQEYRSVGKPGAAVALVDSGRNYRAYVGETLELNLVLDVLRDASSVRVQINADEGILLDGSLMIDLGQREAGRVSLPTLQATPTRDGRASVNLLVGVDNGDGERFRSFSLPIAAGVVTSAQKARTDIVSGESGQMLRIMPATETDY